MAAGNQLKSKKNMLVKRTASALVIFILSLALIITGGWVYTIGLAAILAAAAWEYTRMFTMGEFTPAQVITAAGTAACAIAASYPDFLWVSVVFTISILITIIFHVATFSSHPQNGGTGFAASLSALAYIGFLGSYLVRIRYLPDGLFWIIIAIAPVVINDIAAYLVGSRFGRRPLVPKISPGKTVEGFIAGSVGGILGGLVAGLIAATMQANINMEQGLIIGILVGITCPLGDLAKSLIKREFGLKNTGNLIPGHGGVLDRIDTWMWAGPTAYFLILFFLK